MPTQRSSITRPPRLSGNASENVQVMADYLHQFYTFMVVGSEVPDRINRVGDLPLLAMTVSDPPTQAEMQKIADRLDEIVQSMRTETTNA